MYKVLKNFIDKYTKVKYKVGDEVDFDEKRAKEILKVGKLIEKIEEPIEEVQEVKAEVEPAKKKRSTKKK